MIDTTVESEFATALVRMSHLVQYVFVDVSREHGITPQQAQLLCMLIGGPLGMSELSRLLHLEKSSLSGLVDRVERRDLVTRVGDPRDRRTCQAGLTPAGEQLARDVHNEISARLDAMGQTLPDADRRHATAAITALLAQHTR
ncbi:MarR family winged helix-turn-helix transcriptional regulator [Acrocarpospora catenulata]|uniref:MarR family winged helix-turn-helix transcriptional regulator n=1 Tax=Acrocarpospora catenulata TaxID=2836182 RepID=UPI001BD94C3B|nr:MarR family transcriptional regulator [Acrocarpospora catenulata]